MKKAIIIPLIVIYLIFTSLVIYEFYNGVLRQIDRKNIFTQAKLRAYNLNKPLLVYGDPYYGFGSRFFNIFMDGYKCGDETVDLTGSPKCKNGIKSDILDHLKTKETNSQVIFISCVLEYIKPIDQVIIELKRVAGSLDNIFVVTVDKQSLSAYYYYEDNYKSTNIIYAPPKYKDLTFVRL